MPGLTEADSCRRYVLPKLYAAGWSDDQINEQRTFTDGRIVVAGAKVSRRPQKRADYLLRYKPELMIAVVEAKAAYHHPGDGLQQAKEYAQMLDLKFAYSTNGRGIVEQRGVTLDQLAENMGRPDADPFDLLCYVAYNAPVRTRRERAERLRKGRMDFWESFKPEARQILEKILNKYIEHGTAQFTIPAILNVPPISEHGNVIEIAEKFGGPEKLRSAVETMQTLLYAA